MNYFKKIIQSVTRFLKVDEPHIKWYKKTPCLNKEEFNKLIVLGDKHTYDANGKKIRNTKSLIIKRITRRNQHKDIKALIQQATNDRKREQIKKDLKKIRSEIENIDRFVKEHKKSSLDIEFEAIRVYLARNPWVRDTSAFMRYAKDMKKKFNIDL